MTAFLTQLAGIALGHDSPGAAHVVLPPRFASAAPSAPRLAQAEWPPVEPAATEGAAAGRGQTIQSRRREADEDINAPPAFLPKPNAAPAVRRETTASHRSRAATDAPQRSPPKAAPARSDDPQPSPRENVAVPRPAADMSAVAAQGEAAAAPPLFNTPAAPLAASMPRRDPPPLSDAAVASRLGGPREAAPVVQVTIDRIDLRAPDARKPAEPSKQARQQPAISLADYLRNGAGGSRA